MDKKSSSKPIKEKKRSSERRKEKSRDAARFRRSRETEIFTELASLLPLSQSSLSQLDKASIMRLVISYLRIRNMLDDIPSTIDIKADPKFDSMFLEALTGFLLVLSADGDIVFLSENVHEYLGLSQIDLVGQSIYEVSHPCDHNEMRDILSVKEPSPERSFFLRLKCTLTSKGRSVNLKSASYKVIHCTGHVITPSNDRSEGKADEENETKTVKNDMPSSCCLIAIGEPIPHPSNIEIPLGSRTFLSKHSLDMKFTYADEKMADFLGYNPETLLSKSLYEFHHAQDSKSIEKSFKHLLSKGQSQTEQYRFLVNGGGYVWVLTQASLIYSNKGQKPNSVVCVNFIISGVENQNEIYSACQLLSSGKENEPTAVALDTVSNNCSPRGDAKFSPETTRPIELKPQNVDVKPKVVTSKLFRPAPTINASGIDASAVARAHLNPIQENQLSPPQVRPVSVTSKLFVNLPAENIYSSVKSGTGERSGSDLIESFANGGVIKSDEQFLFDSIEELQNSAPILEKTDRSDQRFLLNEDKGCGNPELQPSRPQTVTSKLFVPYADPSATTAAATSSAAAEHNLTLRPQATTAKIFAPRTEEMNKGFLTFSDDDTGLTMLKDEPEDLTHLAPTAGDVCVPLDTPRFLDTMLDDFINLSDSYGPLLSEATAEGIVKDMSSSDSFFSYRDTLSSSRSLSPSLTQSPDDGSIPSLGTDSPPLEDSTINTLLGLDIDSNELSMRAPYIPEHDLPLSAPLLLSTDLMWGANSTSNNTSNSSSCSSLSKNSYNISSNHNSNMWSPPGSPVPSLQSPDPNSSLARLLRTDSGGGSSLSEILRQRYANKKGDNFKMKFDDVRFPDICGSKRIGGPANDGPWGKTNWKRSRTQSPMARPRILDGGGGGRGGGSVLMNLLVSGCDEFSKNGTEKLSRLKATKEPPPVNYDLNTLNTMMQDSNQMIAIDPKLGGIHLSPELLKALQSAL